jgi:hypothetical protein
MIAHEASCLADLIGLPDSGGHFEEQCIDLLCRQENTLSELSEARRRRGLQDSLDLTRKMLDQLVAFAEMNFSGEQLQNVKRRVSEFDQRTPAYESMIDAQSFKMIKRLVRMTVPDKKEVRVAHEELCNEYVELCKAFFNDCVNRFAEDSAIRKQFLQSVDSFLHELERKW